MKMWVHLLNWNTDILNRMFRANTLPNSFKISRNAYTSLITRELVKCSPKMPPPVESEGVYYLFYPWSSMPGSRYRKFYLLLLFYSHRYRDLISGNREDTQKTCGSLSLEIHAVQEIRTSSELCVFRIGPDYRLYIERYGISNEEMKNEVSHQYLAHSLLQFTPSYF